MTDPEALLAECAKLDAATTPGPWAYDRDHRGTAVCAEKSRVTLCRQTADSLQGRRDAVFIARARTLVPELAAALREALAEWDAIKSDVPRLFERLATVTEALRPFAEWAPMFGAWNRDDDDALACFYGSDAGEGSAPLLTVGHFRRARAALGGNDGR